MDTLTNLSLPRLILIDSDVRRRAMATYGLLDDGIFVDPIESVTELNSRWPERAILLVHDGAGAISSAAASMLNAGVWFPIVAYDESPTTSQIVKAIGSGAIDYLDWPLTAQAISAIAASRTETNCASKAMKHRQLMAQSRIKKLTPREYEVLGGVADGLSNRQIGDRLCISPRTVEIHRANLMAKIGARHTSEAIRVAIEAEIGTPRQARAA